MLVLSTDANVSVHSQSNLAKIRSLSAEHEQSMFSSVLVEGTNLKTILYLSMNVLQGVIIMKTTSLQFHKDEKEAVKKISSTLSEY